MEDELKATLASGTKIVVRVERTRSTDEVSSLRASSVDLLRSVSTVDHAAESMMVNQRYQIKQALRPVDASEATVAERVFRDTDNLLLRSSDVTLATTSSHIIEEMIADGDQFDWVIVEEAARANGAELIGALLLGNRKSWLAITTNSLHSMPPSGNNSTIPSAQLICCGTRRSGLKPSPIYRRKLLRRLIQLSRANI